MSLLTTAPPARAESSGRASRPAGAYPDGPWAELRQRFFDALNPRQREPVAFLLRHRYHGGAGLRQWLRGLAVGATALPAALPPGLIEVYLTDPEALPLHDCAGCGLAV